MRPRLILTCLLLIGLTFFSCNPTVEKSPEIASAPVSNTLTEAPMPHSLDLSLFEKKFEADSTNYELRAMLASNYYLAGVLDKAAYHFLKVYEHDKKNLDALSNLGNIYYDAQQDDKAIQFYEKALEIDPKNINMRCDLATCYGNINKLKKAIQILRENIIMDNNHAQSHHNLSVFLTKNGNLKEAEEEMKIYQNLSSGIK